MTSDLYCMHKSGHLEKAKKKKHNVGKRLPGRKTKKQIFKLQNIGPEKDTAGMFSQNLYFSSVSGASHYKKAVRRGGGREGSASVFCSVEPGEFSSHTTP